MTSTSQLPQALFLVAEYSVFYPQYQSNVERHPRAEPPQGFLQQRQDSPGMTAHLNSE
jgi:hypothetical protein